MHATSWNSNPTVRADITPFSSLGSSGLSQPKPRTVDEKLNVLLPSSVTAISVHG